MPLEEIDIDAAAQNWRAFSDVIDVRTEAEFAEDHIPGALNLPVLTTGQRAEVGTLYVRESRFLARKIGAAYVAANAARHLQGALADKSGAYAPLVHCWRGGQRSRGLALILDQIGWRVRLLAGGYRAYRRQVSARLYGDEPWFGAVLLEGPTGVGKTEILKRLAARGARMLDLEALAAHRGSIFGAAPDAAQPSQKLFETRVLSALCDPAAAPGPVFLEAESSKLGKLLTPPTLWKAMQAAPRIRIEAPLAARAGFCVAQYADLVADGARLDALLTRLTPHAGHAAVAEWRALARSGAYPRLAEALMARHYDPAYARSAKRSAQRPLGTVRLEALTPDAFEAAAAAVLALLEKAPPHAAPATTQSRAGAA
ncbi:MAG: tRNA 2-selenouridine(34) synthase MnmH [Pseudomonadota bacterium]